ncbi:MAG: hypothetical protein P8M30_17520 [Planctomycetaceae bacterium]|nr:hypothetical protein [Planctomycetaceae bacterium]
MTNHEILPIIRGGSTPWRLCPAVPLKDTFETFVTGLGDPQRLTGKATIKE